MEFSKEESKVINGAMSLPSVSVILPFNTKVSLKEELQHDLKLVRQEVERMLLELYGQETVGFIVQKLEDQIGSVDFKTDKKSIAIYVSPLVAKTFYLDIDVEKKIIVDESFEIRDLVYSKQAAYKYLLLLINGKHARLLLGTDGHLVHLKIDSAEHIAAYKRDIAERVFNFSDQREEKNILLEKFLRHTDAGINNVLNAYQLPLFVVGAEKPVSHFRKITKHKISGCIYGNYEDASEQQLIEKVKPLIAEQRRTQTKELLKQLDIAIKAKQLVAGIAAVWSAASEKQGKLLVVEKNFSATAEHTDRQDFIRKHDPLTDGFYIKDVVDDIIEMVLDGGGDVAFVEDGDLNDYLHIALITFYK